MRTKRKKQDQPSTASLLFRTTVLLDQPLTITNKINISVVLVVHADSTFMSLPVQNDSHRVYSTTTNFASPAFGNTLPHTSDSHNSHDALRRELSCILYLCNHETVVVDTFILLRFVRKENYDYAGSLRKIPMTPLQAWGNECHLLVDIM